MGNFQNYIQVHPPTDMITHFENKKDNLKVLNCNEQSKYSLLQNIIPMLSDFFFLLSKIFPIARTLFP